MGEFMHYLDGSSQFKCDIKVTQNVKQKNHTTGFIKY